MVLERDTREEAAERAAYLFLLSVLDDRSRQSVNLQTMTMLGLRLLGEPLVSTPFVFVSAIAAQ